MVFIDFLKIKKHIKEGECFNNSHLKLFKEESVLGVYKQHYRLSKDYTECSIIFIPHYNILEVELSVPYFWSGHNFEISIREEETALQFISDVIEIDLSEGEVQQFECGSVIQIPFHSKHIFRTHYKAKNKKAYEYPDGKYFKNSVSWIKMYNGNKNFKKKISKAIRNELCISTNYDETKDYLKFELKFLKPNIAFKRRIILTKDLFTLEFQDACKEQLLIAYASITQMKSVSVTSRKQLSIALIGFIGVMSLKEIAEIIPEVHLMGIIDAHSHLLSPHDRKARKAMVRKNIAKLQTGESPYDISDLLRASLG